MSLIPPPLTRDGILVSFLKGIAVAIGWILEHPDEAQQMGVNDRRVALENFIWHAWEANLIAHYQAL